MQVLTKMKSLICTIRQAKDNKPWKHNVADIALSNSFLRPHLIGRIPSQYSDVCPLVLDACY